MQFKIPLLLFIAVSLIACKSTPEYKDSSISPVAQKGFSLSLSDQEEWAVVKKTPYKIVMTKSGVAYDDRYKIQALVVKLPKFKNDQDFLEFVTKRMRKSHQQKGVRVVEAEAKFVKRDKSKCVQYSSKRQYPGKSKPVMLEVVSFTCRHPERNNAGVYLAYSKKYSKGNRDRYLGKNARGIFKQMELAAF